LKKQLIVAINDHRQIKILRNKAVAYKAYSCIIGKSVHIHISAKLYNEYIDAVDKVRFQKHFVKLYKRNNISLPPGGRWHAWAWRKEPAQSWN
jgi:hypothetical protein